MDADRFEVDRRTMLAGVGACAVAAPVRAATSSIPIIDTHIHLFDPNRPQGVPYRGPKGAQTYMQGASPQLYGRLMRQQGVIGAIAVEASPWIEDNLWLLETAERDPIMLGVIGNMQPDAPDFAATIDRYHKNPLFRGVRYGNLWRYDIVDRAGRADFLAGLRVLAAADLVLETANPRLDLLQAIVRISDAVPSLRIMIDHLPHYDPAPDEEVRYREVLTEIAHRPGIFVKLSEVIHPVAGQVSLRLAEYRPRLDLLIATFGPDRVLFGSDWPNIEQDTPVANEFAIMRQLYADKPQAEQENFFWRNAARAYRCAPRDAGQRALLSRG